MTKKSWYNYNGQSPLKRNSKQAPDIVLGAFLFCKKGGVGVADKLTRREQTILNYKANGGNMKKAMIDAGYSENYADKNSRYLLGIVGQEIKAAQDTIKNEKIKSVAQIQEWWTNIMDDEDVDIRDKIKVSELLAKSQGGFIDKVEMNASVNNPLEHLTTEELKKLIDDD